MTEDEEEFHIPVRKQGERLVPLRDGTQADIEEVEGKMAAFRLLRKKEPRAFQALYDLATGQADHVSKANMNVLQNWHSFLDKSGDFQPMVRELLLLAGPDLNDLYCEDTIKDKWMLAIAKEEHRETLDKGRPLLDVILGRPKGGKGHKESR